MTRVPVEFLWNPQEDFRRIASTGKGLPVSPKAIARDGPPEPRRVPRLAEFEAEVAARRVKVEIQQGNWWPELTDSDSSFTYPFCPSQMKGELRPG